MKGVSALPQHVSIIMDGNGRWAQSRYLPRTMGHRAGSKAVRRAIQYCIEHDIPVLSLFALGIDNRLQRPADEVTFLLNLFLESLRKNTVELHKKNIRVEIVGDRSKMSELLQQHVEYIEALTRQNTALHLLVAVDYSGRWDVTQATQKLMALGQDPASVTEAAIEAQLCFSHVPQPDLMIRTSGEQRLSNFMLWQMAYTEFYFSDLYWPDFDKNEFQKAVDTYTGRERRFGRTSEQRRKQHA